MCISVYVFYLQIIVRNLPENSIETNVFDAVLVCNGHYNTPAFPNYDGRQLYKGQQIHSHDYRCAEPFKGNLFREAHTHTGSGT